MQVPDIPKSRFPSPHPICLTLPPPEHLPPGPYHIVSPSLCAHITQGKLIKIYHPTATTTTIPKEQQQQQRPTPPRHFQHYFPAPGPPALHLSPPISPTSHDPPLQPQNLNLHPSIVLAPLGKQQSSSPVSPSLHRPATRST